MTIEFDRGRYDQPVKLLHEPKEVVAAMVAARTEFLARLLPGGLTILPEVSQRWWPIDKARAAMKAAS